ncbi:hypothetical protein [Myxococcus landrumensis]|uniref:Lipoprotein n=1 Tax=Myxococcus landrumensis TaxID=2813577 RepID=A0ABX7N0D5_9BACT|nr:hypothetical protein [Myxococcus landrumus]QSQ10861.1 hypothetical protein JY572_20750 [Myxococcus landrumus]
MKSLWVAGTLLLAACGGAEAPEDTAPLGESQSALEYDESIHCLVSSSMVQCPGGVYAYAQWSDTMGSWYIERDACGSQYYPLLCALAR